MAVRLTDKSILSLRPQQGERAELFDLQEPGLLIRATSGGIRTWYFRYRTIDGRQPRYKLGTYPATGVADARKKAQAARGLVEAGADPAALERQAEAKAKAEAIRTYSDLVDAYFVASELGTYRPRGRPKKAKTILAERKLYERHIKKALARLPYGEVGRAEVKALTRAMLAKGITTQTNHAQAFVRQTFSYALDEELVAFNPIMSMSSPAPKRPRERTLDDDELRLLWTALKAPSTIEGDDGETATLSEGVSIALRLTALLLQRRAEIAGMRLSDLDLRQNVWILADNAVKNGRTHQVPLPPLATALIREALGLKGRPKSPFVFPSPRNPNEPISPDALTRAMGRVVKLLGMPLAGPHDLRRTGASLLASERGGTPPFIISQVLNHTTDTGGGSATTRRHYNLYLYAKEKRQALVAWESILREIVGEPEPSSNVISIPRSA
jgi:integrase